MASIEVDGRMCEDIRIGIIIRGELLPDGGCWHKKDGTAFDMSFSSTLLEVAGGIRRLLTEWEPERGSPLWKKWNEVR